MNSNNEMDENTKTDFVLIKKFDSINKLDECIYCEFYYTKQKNVCLFSCKLCENENHKMQCIYRTCYCFDENCDLKLKLLICHKTQNYLLLSKGTHPGKALIPLQNETICTTKKISNGQKTSVQTKNSGTFEKRNFARKFTSVPLLDKKIFEKIVKSVDYFIIEDLKEIYNEIEPININLTYFKHILKLIKFDQNQSLSFIRTFMKLKLSEEYCQNGFSSTDIYYYSKENCVKFSYICKNCIKYNKAKNRITATYYMDHKIVLVQSNSYVCDC